MAEAKPKVVSLFSGCGGLDLGFRGDFTYLDKYYPPTGMEIVMANDIAPWACETYRKYFGDHIQEGDISGFDFETLPNCDVVIGGFPCQDFSITRATARQGLQVKRGKLYQEFVGVVSAKKPRLIVAENVKGILSANKGLAIKIIAEDFANLGYIVKYHLWSFADYGVPQIRQRVILVGVREDVDFDYRKPLPTHENNHVASITALQGVEGVKFNSEHLRIKERTRRVIAAIPEGGNNDDTTDRSLYVKGIMSNIYRRLDRSKPSPTIIAAGGGGTWGYHYEEPRPLTNRERARLQTFPDDFEFMGSTTEARRQIGNAVPPLGAYVVAQAVKPALYAGRRTKEQIDQARRSSHVFGQLELSLA
ncbi:DNA cytosine methyltransferase [Chloroflexota bacterium]